MYRRATFKPLTQENRADFAESVAVTLALKNRPASFVGWLLAADEPLTVAWGQSMFEALLSPADREIAESYRDHCLTIQKEANHG